MLKAVYRGTENYLGTTNVINFSITPCMDQSVFSVTSNSSLAELVFNTARKELSFKVSGDAGTTGYVSLYIPNSLVSDISDLKLYLDSAQMDTVCSLKVTAGSSTPPTTIASTPSQSI
jgi:hypothetical protein